MAQLTKRFMKQKFVGLLIILVGTMLLLAFGLVPAEIYQSIILWSFAVFTGTDTLELGSIQAKEFMVQKEKVIIEKTAAERERTKQDDPRNKVRE